MEKEGICTDSLQNLIDVCKDLKDLCDGMITRNMNDMAMLEEKRAFLKAEIEKRQIGGFASTELPFDESKESALREAIESFASREVREEQNGKWKG